MKDNFFKDPKNQTKAAAAILAACIVRTLNERDKGFQEAFQDELQRAYKTVRDEGEYLDCLETLAWASQILKKRDYRFGHEA